MAGCPLCGSPIEGREAVEVRQEHREMVVSAKAGHTLADVAESVVGDLQMLAGRAGRYEDEDETFRQLREEAQDAAGDLSVALKQFRKVAGWS